ncbi:MAG TPA: DUF547 domain-containing protein [Methylomirabilota bacterium]|nr:DUF547 domain-containing protein [Methylomirabilota bacterium]
MGASPLNTPAADAPVEPGPAAERLQAAMLAALGAHLDAEGCVDYDRLAASAEFAAAAAAAHALGGARLAALADRSVRLAFWINVYNALVFHGIVALGVRRSVRRVWNFFGRVRYGIGGLAFSLDDIEHGLLRGNRRRKLPPLRPFGAGDPRLALAVTPPDPRYHFAVSCGAASCPPIGVYRAAAIDAQLDLATRNFVNQAVALVDGRLACSRIFEWYREDFEAAGGLRTFLLRHLDDGPARAALAGGATPCEVFQPYRWSLQHQALRR